MRSALTEAPVIASPKPFLSSPTIAAAGVRSKFTARCWPAVRLKVLEPFCDKYPVLNQPGLPTDMK